MVSAEIFLGYDYDQHLFRRGRMTDIQYQDIVLDSTVILYATAIGPTFVLIDACPYWTVLVEDFLEREGIVWSGRRTRQTLIPFKITDMPLDVLIVQVS